MAERDPRGLARTRSDALGGSGAGRALVLATAGFAVTFWAWALLSPLGATLREDLGLTAFQQSLLVAVPVIVGSLGRIPVGALTDRLGARRMFPTVALLTVLPVLYLGHFADSLAGYLVGGFFLGLGGTTFAIGVPFVNSWYPPERRGLALGVFGAGMGGTAISAFSTVQLSAAFGPSFPFDLVAVVLVAFAGIAVLLLRDRPDRPVPTGSVLARFGTVLRMPVALQLAFLYAVAFGGFVAFSVYLPSYLTTAYGLERGDAALRTAGFVVLAVAMRPVGGWLCDRFPPVPVLTGAFAAVCLLAVLASFELPLVPVGTVWFLGLAAALGIGTGAVFALVARLVEPERVGAVTGLVGAAGGLGGFFPPLVMGLVYGVLGDYSLGFVLLALTAATAGALTATALRRRVVGGASISGEVMVAAETDQDVEPPQEILRTAAEHASTAVPVAAPSDTATDVLNAMRGRVFDSAAVVAVCEGGRLTGLITIERLLAAPPNAPLIDLADLDPPVVAPHTNQELVAWTAVEHGEPGLAVVDDERRFRGLIPPQRMLAVLLAEHDEDMARLGGFLHSAAAARSASQESVRRRLWHRLPWLAIGLAGAMVAAGVVGAFEADLQREVLLAFFVPGVVYMADAVGTQTETLVIRGLSVGVGIGRVVFRELVTGLIVGILLAAVVLPFTLLVWGNAEVAVTVSLALLGACSVATLVAMALPWAFSKLGRDPAFGSGPLATVLQDLLSIVIYLAIARAIVG